MVATAVLLLFHMPPLTDDVSVVVAASHTLAEPEMLPAEGNGLIVIGAVTTAEPQPLVTV
jgi:hypothetical protein